MENSFRLKKCNKLSSAFTLAEILVTLGIIGVVSAMTVPTLMQNYQRKSYVTQLHKVYNEMQQAFTQLMADRNASTLTEAGLKRNVDSFFKTYLKISKDCGTAMGDCFASKYGFIEDSKTVSLASATCNKVVTLNSGAVICFDVENGQGESANEENGGSQTGSTTDLKGAVATIEVDVNGVQGPNIYGRDYFVMYVDNSGNLKDYEYDQNGFTAGSDGGSINGAFGKIMEDGWEMKY